MIVMIARKKIERVRSDGEEIAVGAERDILAQDISHLRMERDNAWLHGS
jgi:hypothetical protein